MSNFNELENAMNNLFKNSKPVSNYSIKGKEREQSLSTFIARIRPQILVYNDNNLPWDTPKEWDESFKKLEKGSSFRTSKAILKRMTWDELLEVVENIILEKEKFENE